MKVVSIHQPQYVPYLGYFHKIRHCDIFVHLDHVQYEIGGLQNRNKIKSKDGWQWFTLPVNGGPDTRIDQVRIDPRSNWRKKHWGTLQANYARAPHFRKYAQTLQPLYSGSDDNQLSSVNRAFSDWAMAALGLTTPTVLSSSLDPAGASSAMLIDLCRKLGGTHYLAGPGGRRYMDLELFARSGIEVIWQEFHAPTYPQVYPDAGFVENLSILDLLFSLGDGAAAVLAA
ncbi:MAG TPA: WbqC family protein [Solimonas sp.]|nr:WbqC family protein [Solimonas sp.]